ncbi:homocysteine S-methyltransferase family protein [Aureimonas altamirensis]|uniref:homocysteine S-methyltransferase family protein n=1 Tax=Aureimonas altamirensis TaxID=370622 RepID=UPI00301A03BC
MTEVTILDGGMSRELQRLGARLRQPEWSALALIESPDIVRNAHTAFIDAGADVVTTNSYALVPFHIGEARFRREGAELIALSGRLAREAADAAGRRIVVAGSLPPIFGSYEPELFRQDDVQDYLSVLVDNLDPYVDVWLGETLSLIAEGRAVSTAVAATGKPFWISFTLSDGPGAETEEPTLRSGESVRDAAAWAVEAGAAALLFNCSRPEVMGSAVATAAKIIVDAGSAIKLGVYANAFEAASGGAANETLTELRTDLTDDRYNRFACEWAEAGATMIGGCCGVGAHHIHSLRQAMR